MNGVHGWVGLHYLPGVKVGDRWQDLYEVGQQIAGQHVITASDVSILTSYLGAGKLSDARKFLESVKQFLWWGWYISQSSIEHVQHLVWEYN